MGTFKVNYGIWFSPYNMKIAAYALTYFKYSACQGLNSKRKTCVTKQTLYCVFFKKKIPSLPNFTKAIPRNENHHLSLLSFSQMGNFNWGPVYVTTSFLRRYPIKTPE